MSEQQTDQRMCRFPGCEREAMSFDGTGRPPEYCDDPAHTRAAAWRARQKLHDGPRPVEAHPIDAARQRASMISGQVTGMIEHLGQQLAVLVDELRTIGDPEAVEVQIEAVSSEAAEQVATANARAARAEQAQRRAEAEKAEADDAATEATTALEQLTAELEQSRADLAEITQTRDLLVDELTDARATMAAEQERAQEELAQLHGQLEAAQSDLHRVTGERDAALTRSEDSERAMVSAEERASAATAETEQLRSTAAELHSNIAVLSAERDAARAEATRERSYGDQRVADLQSTYDRQLDQRLQEIAQAREDAQAQRTRADRAEALLSAVPAAPKRRQGAGRAPEPEA